MEKKSFQGSSNCSCNFFYKVFIIINTIAKRVNYILRSVQDAREAKRKSQTKSHALFSNIFHIWIICKDEYQVYIKNYKNFRFGTFRARSNRRSFVDSIRKIGNSTQKRYIDETKDTMTIWYEDRTLSARSSSRRRCHASSSGGCLLVTKKTLGHSGETFTQSDRSVTGLWLHTYRLEESVEEGTIMMIRDREIGLIK